MEDPEWKDIVPHFRHMSETELEAYNLTGITSRQCSAFMKEHATLSHVLLSGLSSQ